MLKANTVLTNLDISFCADYTAGPDSAEFSRELAVGIKDNKALTKLDISRNYIGAEQEGGLQRICVVAGGIELAK
jgi:hypothetical protein